MTLFANSWNQVARRCELWNVVDGGVASGPWSRLAIPGGPGVGALEQCRLTNLAG